MRADLEWGSIPGLVGRRGQAVRGRRGVGRRLVAGGLRRAGGDGHGRHPFGHRLRAGARRPGRHLGAEHPRVDRRRPRRARRGRCAGAAEHPLQGPGGGRHPGAERGQDAVLRERVPRQRLPPPAGGGRGRAARPAPDRDPPRRRGRRDAELGGVARRRREGGAGGGGGADRCRQPRGPVRHHLHVGDDGAAQRSDVHPQPDPAGVR